MNTIENIEEGTLIALTEDGHFSRCALCFKPMDEVTVYMHSRCWQIISDKERVTVQMFDHYTRGNQRFVVVPAAWRNRAEKYLRKLRDSE